MTTKGRLTIFAFLLVVITAPAVGYLSVDKPGSIVQAASRDAEPVEDPTTTTVAIMATTTTAAPTTTIATTTTVARTTTTHTHAPATSTTAAVVTVPTTRAVSATVTTVAARVIVADPICTYILVDISKQTLSADCTDEDFTIPISSGGEYWYTDPTTGEDVQAITPRVAPKLVHRMYDGTEEAPLGTLYRPMYFYKGYAIHGGNLPGYPASHGCIRVRNPDADWLFERVRVGVTAVEVVD